MVSRSRRTPPTSINKFLGLNMDITGETQLNVGESPYMVNFQITENYKLKKVNGYTQLFDNIAARPIQGMWRGKINGAYHFLYACDGKLYKYDNGINTELGTLTDAKTFFFAFNDKVYILNGVEYKYWDGVDFLPVAGYRPLIAINTPPAGGGTLYEQINVLTGAKRQTFSPDETVKAYQLAETNIDSIDYVKVNGELKTITTDYTVDLANGKVNFVTAPETGNPGSIEIGWTKGTGQRDLILKCRAALLYGGANDTRVFMWGNGDYKNRRFYSGLADGVPSAEYFPANYWSDVGSDEFEITDIVKQFDRQIIFTENKAYYSYFEMIGDEVAFPVYPLNDVKGNKAFNQARIVLNNPYTIMEGVYEWLTTSVRDERNVRYMSKRVQPALDEVDLTAAITYDHEVNGEYWLSIANNVYIYNYRNDTWYYYQFSHNITSFISINDVLYFGTDNGQIMKFDAAVRDFNGQAITAIWEMSFYDFNAEYILKYVNQMWISLKPDTKSSLDVFWQTDKDPNYISFLDFNEIDFSNFTFSTPSSTIGYNLLDYGKINYRRWTYNTDNSPQPFGIKLKAKKFTYFKIILYNDDIYDSSTVLSINIAPRFGGVVK